MAKKYDLVWIKDLSRSSMSHFEQNCRGIVVSSYREKYGSKSQAFCEGDEYTVFIEGHGEVSWYEDWCFDESKTEPNRKDLLDTWIKLEEERKLNESNTKWIFNHFKTLSKDNSLSGTAICALAKDMGISENAMWGSHGEGFVFAQNAYRIMSEAKPYLTRNDYTGWQKFCKKFKKENKL